MARLFSVYLPAILFVFVVIGLLVFPQPIDHLANQLSAQGVYGQTVYVLLLVIATVFAPITLMPIIPLATTLFGPFATAILSIIGWSIGAVIAFLIARYLGRPILQRIVSLREIDHYVAELPANTRFLVIVLMRMVIPVDVLSYALGLTKGVRFIEYTVATVIGISWFAFAFAYLGDALLTGNMPLLTELGGLSLLIFIGAWYMLRRTKGSKQDRNTDT